MRAKLREKLDFLKKLSQLFDKGEKRHFLLIMTVVLVMSIFQALGVASIFPFISLIIDPDIIFESGYLSWAYNYFNFEDARSFTIAAGFVSGGIIVIGNLISVIAIWLKNRFVWMQNHQLSASLMRKYLSFPYLFYLRSNTSALEKNVLVEVQRLTSNFILPALEIATDMVFVILIFAALIIISPLASIIIILLFSIFYGIVFQIGLRGKLKTRGVRRLKEETERFKAVSEALGGIKDIKVLGREKFFFYKFRDHSFKFSNLLSWHFISQQVPRYFIEIIAFGGVIVFILLLMLMDVSVRLVIPMVSFFAFAGYRLLPVMNKMFQCFAQLQFNTSVLDIIYEDLNAEEGGDILAEPAVENGVSFSENIIFRNLSFKYPVSTNYVLKGINLEIQKNTAVAFAGPTGTGKTTLVDVLMGLLTPTEGELRVDGERIGEDNVRSWQKLIGYVPQYIYLSDDSLRRNIAFGLPDELIEDEKVERAAKIANLHDFVVDYLPDGYNSVIGERGVRLSGGQKQRVGIARALYHDPEVLVFDEATSSLDGATEEVVLKAIDDISKMKTIVIIAHRLTTVRKCDIIYLLDKGKVAASGSYDELMENNARFRALGGGG